MTIEFPITVKKFETKVSPNPIEPCAFRRGHEGSWVAVRVAGEEKTHLGILLGDVRLPSLTFDSESGTMTLAPGIGNPIMWVPDLKRTVLGMESWWGIIDSPERLREITDADIQNVWYVRALKDLTEAEAAKAEDAK